MARKYYIHVNDFKNLQSNVMTSQQFSTNFSCRFFRAPGRHCVYGLGFEGILYTGVFF